MIVVRRCLALATLCGAAPLGAQNTTPSAGGTQTSPPAAPPRDSAVGMSTFNFSGVIFGSFNYKLPTTPAQLPSQINNVFIIDRAYLNFRMTPARRTSIRITTDVFQQNDSSNAYTVRAKYAYLQYDAPAMSNGLQLTGRLGILQNVIIDQVDLFYPRFLAQAPTERAGYFASADVGLAGLLTFPGKRGEVYATIVNGPGYTSKEIDRFKDYAARLTFTPFMNRPASSLLQTFTISGWVYKGAFASKFVNGGTGQVGAVGSSLNRTRAGVFAGIRDPKLVLAVDFAPQYNGGELGQNTVASPRIPVTTRGRLLSGLSIVRPFAFSNASGKSPFGLIGRYDHVKPTVSSSGYPSNPPASANAYHFLIGGMFYEFAQRAQIALDYQEALAANNGVSSAPPSQSKVYYAHFVVNF